MNYMRSLFDRIDAKKKALSKCQPTGESQRIQEQFLVNFTYDSNAIEGNSLTLEETALVLKGLTIDDKPLIDHLEVRGHQEAFLYIQSIPVEKTPLTERIIKNIHSLVLVDKPADRGVYRRVPVRIVGAIHLPPQPYSIEPRMQELLDKNEQNRKVLHIIERIAISHLEFECIHPFIDGNGRTGRLILNFELIQYGYPPINIRFTDRNKYYEAFDAYHLSGDASKMIELIAGYLDQQLDQYLSILE